MDALPSGSVGAGFAVRPSAHLPHWGYSKGVRVSADDRNTLIAAARYTSYE
jgi:hypothetical protein